MRVGDDRPDEDRLVKQAMEDVAPMSESAFRSGRDALIARMSHKSGDSPVLADDQVIPAKDDDEHPPRT